LRAAEACVATVRCVAKMNVGRLLERVVRSETRERGRLALLEWKMQASTKVRC
jgi:hypothetical protein